MLDAAIFKIMRIPISPHPQNYQRTKFKIPSSKEARIRTYSVIKCAHPITTCLRLGPPSRAYFLTTLKY